MAAVLEQSFGGEVEQRTIAGEQFDVLYDHQHLLVEIAASVGPTIQTRLERKRPLYEESTGVSPTRVILATASIHSRRAHELRMSGIEVIEPEETPEDTSCWVGCDYAGRHHSVKTGLAGSRNDGSTDLAALLITGTG